MDRKVKRALEDYRDKLAALSKGAKPLDTELGICACISWRKYPQLKAKRIIKKLWKYWPKFSGSVAFPIPATNKRLGADQQYISTRNKWSGKQGKLRRELCAFLVTELDAHIAQLQKEAA